MTNKNIVINETEQQMNKIKEENKKFIADIILYI